MRFLRGVYHKLPEKDHRPRSQERKGIHCLLQPRQGKGRHGALQPRLHRLRTVRKKLSRRGDRDGKRAACYRLFQVHRVREMRRGLPAQVHQGNVAAKERKWKIPGGVVHFVHPVFCKMRAVFVHKNI